MFFNAPRRKGSRSFRAAFPLPRGDTCFALLPLKGGMDQRRRSPDKLLAYVQSADCALS